MINVGFIGAGNMGGAIMKGIMASSIGGGVKLYAYDSYEPAMEKIVSAGVMGVKSEAEVVRSCKYVFLAVKPQQLDEILEAIKNDVTEDTVLVSICAGITDEYIQSKTVGGAKVIMVMPNTPLSVIIFAEPVSDFAKSCTAALSSIPTLFAYSIKY